VIILAVCLGKKDDINPGPGPNPPAPPFDVNPYKVVSDSITNDGSKITGMMQVNGNSASALSTSQDTPLKVKAQPESIPKGDNNKLFDLVSFEFGQSDYKTAYINLVGQTNGGRYSPDSKYVGKVSDSPLMRLSMSGLTVFDDPFGFEYANPTDPADVILHTNQSSVLLMDKYLQLDLQLPSRRIYGLGARTSQFALGEGTWTMWSRSRNGSVYDDGTGAKQGGGVHPFALIQSSVPGEFFGVFFRNTNAMSPVITYTGDSTSTLSVITTGGNLEIYLMFKGSAQQIISQYQKIIGLPALPPFWALGF